MELEPFLVALGLTRDSMLHILDEGNNTVYIYEVDEQMETLLYRGSYEWDGEDCE